MTKRSYSTLDIAPASYLLSAPQTPSVSQTGISPSLAVLTFQKYKHAVQQRVDGRTPFVERLISETESGALRLRQDLEVTIGDDSDSRLVGYTALATLLLTA